MWNPFKKKSDTDALTSEEIQRILQAYGALLEDQANPMIMDESRLPASKNKVKMALWAAIVTARSNEEREGYKAAYAFLSSFLPGVGPKGVNLSPDNADSIDEFLRWSEKWEEESRKLKQELEVILKKFGIRSK